MDCVTKRYVKMLRKLDKLTKLTINRCRFAVVVPHCQLTQKAKNKCVSVKWWCGFRERFGFHTFLIGRKRVAKKVTF
jgi:hypothetical protein